MDLDPRFWNGKQVCVTGGTGLLGYQVVRCLLDAGADVRVMALQPEARTRWSGDQRVRLIWGDVRDPFLVRHAVSGCDVVFHLAGVVAVWGAALEAGQRRPRRRHQERPGGRARPARVVVTSSVVTVGASLDREPLDEESEFTLDHLKIDYVHAKRAAERVALGHAARGGDVVVTNPGYLIGPDDFERSVMGRFCVRYWRGMLPVSPPGGVNLVDVRDVARGHLLAAERGRAGQRYILGGENRTFAEFMAVLAEVVGFRPRATPVLPYWGIAALAGCGECPLVAHPAHPYPALQHARLNRYHWFYRSDRAASELGYDEPPARRIARRHPPLVRVAQDLEAARRRPLVDAPEHPAVRAA